MLSNTSTPSADPLIGRRTRIQPLIFTIEPGGNFVQGLVTASTVICYALYTVLGPTPWMTITLPYVLYGIFRYIYLVEQKGEGGAPDETFLKDLPLLVTVGLYGVTAAGVLVGEQLGFVPGNGP